MGLRHATDADHVVAVSTIVGQHNNPWRGLWIGASWGLGHTTPLLILGTVILFLKEAVLDRYEAIAPALEFGVGVMLVALGLQVFWNLRRGRLHVHEHTHEGVGQHIHVHASHPASNETDTQSDHIRAKAGRGFFRLKSYIVGVVHGLAGSAAVMLLLLPQVSSVALGVVFILLFGLGTIISMGAITLLLGVPFALTDQFAKLNGAVVSVAGVASVLFGVALMVEIGLGISLVPL